MDIFQTAGYFDEQFFDVFDFGTRTWLLKNFKGQLKKTDTFTEIWNRPTRKRLLTCTPDQVPVPTHRIIRVPESAEVFMIGADHKDAWNGFYRYVAGLHKVSGQALVRRKAPIGASNDPGWAVEALVIDTFGDAELRSADENEDRALEHYGSFFVFLPLDTPLARDDTVEISGRVYYVSEWYVDSGLMSARCTVTPDERVNVVYISTGAETYDPATQTTSTNDASYNVTGRVKTTANEEAKADENVLSNAMHFQIRKNWIGVEPKVNDKIVVNSRTYNVENITTNALQDEWYIDIRI